LIIDGSNSDKESTGAVNKSQITISEGKNINNVGTIISGAITSSGNITTSTGTITGKEVKIGSDALTANYAYKSGKGYV
jgi:hypothetical protein